MHLYQNGYPNWSLHLHLSMARTCRVIGGIATDAYMHAMKKTGKVGAVRLGPWCVDLLPSSWLPLLIRIFAGFFLLRIILGLNEPFRSNTPREGRFSEVAHPMTQTYQPVPVNIAVAVGLKMGSQLNISISLRVSHYMLSLHRHCKR